MSPDPMHRCLRFVSKLEVHKLSKHTINNKTRRKAGFVLCGGIGIRTLDTV